MDSFQGLTTKSPSSWHRPLAPSPIFYEHVNPVTRRTIDQSAGGKLCDQNAHESWMLLEDLALYDNESWNDPMDFAKPVKEISLPQDVPNPEQAYVEYASSCTDEARDGLVSNFMASQDARLSKFEADFKQQQSEITNKIDIVLKAITDQIAGTPPSNMIKNLKLNTYPVLSARSYLIEDLQCSTIVHGVVRFANRSDEVAYKMPQKIEQYNSLSDLEKEHTMLVYLRREEDKRRGVEYVMSKILGFYKECLELRPDYATGMDDEGEVT
nr:MAK10-like protein [Tanacetum cinerariifolium]